MEHLNISNTIREACKKNNIPYYSPHLGQAIVLMDDVNKLEEVFLKIKGIISELKKIKVKHQNMSGFTLLMQNIISSLEDVDRKIEAEVGNLVTMKKKLRRMGR